MSSKSAADLLRPEDRIYIAGDRGLAGSAIWRALRRAGYENLYGATSAEVDLRRRDQASAYIRRVRPDVVVLAAAKVGGILANASEPVAFLSDNLRIQLNVFEAAFEVGARRLLFLGSSCIYPKFAAQPISESSLMTGPLEPTNEAYAIAKIAGVVGVQAVRQQFHRPWISVMPTNLYGPGDNFDSTTSHVLPALLRRFHEAKLKALDEVVVWGSGEPRREFLHVDDLGEAVLHVLRKYDDPAPINIGSGTDVRIRELAEMIGDVVGFEGRIVFDTSKPDGTPRKLLDVSRVRALGWQSKISLREGIEQTYEWFLQHWDTARLGP